MGPENLAAVFSPCILKYTFENLTDVLAASESETKVSIKS